LFFALSGFLITTLLLRERSVSGDIRIGAFWARRALRIFPLYYACVLANVLYNLTRRGAPVADTFFANLPFFATYTANWFADLGGSGPVAFSYAWSLCTEEQFYLAWPLLLGLRRAPRLLAPLVLGALLALDVLTERGLLIWPPSVARVIQSLATPMLVGALLALGMHSARGHTYLARLLGHRVSSLVIGVVLAIAVVAPWPLLATQALLAAWVASCGAREDHALRPLLTNALVRRVGEVSYGIYMLHVPVVWGCKGVVARLWGPPLEGHLEPARTLGVFTASLLASWGLAELSFRFFERPFLAWGARLRRAR
jgi:peptidoglycan/LPS O-acetylase OafA/YrhL